MLRLSELRASAPAAALRSDAHGAAAVEPEPVSRTRDYSPVAALTQAFEGRSLFDRVFLGLFLAGPAILFAGRMPADLWLSSIAGAFLARSALSRDWSWLREDWVRAAMLFWAFAVLSSAIARDPMLALRDAAGWVRFPLFAVAAACWLAPDAASRRAVIFASLIGVLAMSCGMLVDAFRYYPRAGLNWPYGGESGWASFYLTRIGAAGMVLMVAVAQTGRRKLALAAAFAVVAVLAAALFSGKIMNFLLLCMACAVFVLLHWRRPLRVFLAAAALLAIIAGVFATNPTLLRETEQRLTTSGGLDDYEIVMTTGWRMFLDHPVVGVGASNFRVVCADEAYAEIGAYDDRCRRAAHHYYLQLLAETGLIGAALFIAMLAFLARRLAAGLRAVGRDDERRIVLLALAAPAFVTFFPLAAGNKIFSQWIGVFDWTALAFAAIAAVGATSHRADGAPR